MYNLFSEINNGYNLRYEKVLIKYKKKYINFLDKLVKLNFIKGYKINKRYIYIYLRYYYNKPLFVFKIFYKKSKLQYINSKQVKINIKFYSHVQFFTTPNGILLLEEMLVKNCGGKLLVSLEFSSRNIL
jgi:ribosomal protein S8